MNLRMFVAAMVMCCGFSSNAHAADQPQKSAGASKSTHSKSTSLSTASDATANTDATPRNDRLVLDSTVVTGNRELPKVMYIVPWKKADLGNLPGQPFNTLLDETLMPVDRDVFRREVQYYQVISDKDRTAAEQSTPKPDSKPGSK